jgi:hypothetical protein
MIEGPVESNENMEDKKTSTTEDLTKMYKEFVSDQKDDGCKCTTYTGCYAKSDDNYKIPTHHNWLKKLIILTAVGGDTTMDDLCRMLILTVLLLLFPVPTISVYLAIVLYTYATYDENFYKDAPTKFVDRLREITIGGWAVIGMIIFSAVVVLMSSSIWWKIFNQ